MTGLLGQQPRYLGWLDAAKGAYGFLFRGQAGNVLAAWSPVGKAHRAKFSDDVRVMDLAGRESSLKAGQELTLTRTPGFILRLPAGLEQQARANLGKPYPWGGDYLRTAVVSIRLGATNITNGITQVNPHTTAPVVVGDVSWRRTNFAVGGEGRYVYFLRTRAASPPK